MVKISFTFAYLEMFNITGPEKLSWVKNKATFFLFRFMVAETFGRT